MITFLELSIIPCQSLYSENKDFYNFIEKKTFVCNTDNQQLDIIALKKKRFYFLTGHRNKIRWSCINLLHSGDCIDI